MSWATIKFSLNMYNDKEIDIQTNDNWKTKDSPIVNENPYTNYL